MTRQIIWFLLACNVLVLCLCAYYLLRDDVIVLDDGVPVIQFPSTATSRLLGTLPFLISFFYLLQQTWKTRPGKDRLSTLDAPEVDEDDQ